MRKISFAMVMFLSAAPSGYAEFFPTNIYYMACDATLRSEVAAYDLQWSRQVTEHREEMNTNWIQWTVNTDADVDGVTATNRGSYRVLVTATQVSWETSTTNVATIAIAGGSETDQRFNLQIFGSNAAETAFCFTGDIDAAITNASFEYELLFSDENDNYYEKTISPNGATGFVEYGSVAAGDFHLEFEFRAIAFALASNSCSCIQNSRFSFAFFDPAISNLSADAESLDFLLSGPVERAHIESASDLIAGDWQEETNAVVSGGSDAISVPLDGGSRAFYRYGIK